MPITDNDTGREAGHEITRIIDIQANEANDEADANKTDKDSDASKGDSDAGKGDKDDADNWQEIPVEFDAPSTADIFQIARFGESHNRTRYLVNWTPRDPTTGEAVPPPEEQWFNSRTAAIEYMIDVAPMAAAAPTLTVEAWLYDPELYIHTGRKRYGWEPIQKFELVSTRKRDFLVEVQI